MGRYATMETFQNWFFFQTTETTSIFPEVINFKDRHGESFRTQIGIKCTYQQEGMPAVLIPVPPGEIHAVAYFYTVLYFLACVCLSWERYKRHSFRDFDGFFSLLVRIEINILKLRWSLFLGLFHDTVPANCVMYNDKNSRFIIYCDLRRTCEEAVVAYFLSIIPTFRDSRKPRGCLFTIAGPRPIFELGTSGVPSTNCRSNHHTLTFSNEHREEH
jgi:hypothetical protein